MNKYFFIILFSMIFCNTNLFGNDSCFIAKDLKENKLILIEGNKCDSQHSPASSFKIALSLIGFNEKILTDENNPRVGYKSDFRQDLNFDPLANWIGEQNPSSWMKNSIVWYSQQVITKKIGIKKFQDYMNNFNYGNKDLSGDHRKDNGLTHAWLSSSLKISPKEQLEFLEKFLINENEIISNDSREKTKNLIFKKEIGKNFAWKLFGKTGSGNLLNAKYQKDIHYPFGWFVGFIENLDNKNKIVFANYIAKENLTDQNIYIGKEAEKIVIEKLEKIIE